MVSEKKGRGKEVAARGRKRGEARVRSGAAGLLIWRGNGGRGAELAVAEGAPLLCTFGVRYRRKTSAGTTGVRAVGWPCGLRAWVVGGP